MVDPVIPAYESYSSLLLTGSMAFEALVSQSLD